MKKLIFLFAVIAVCFSANAQTKSVSWPAGEADFIVKTDSATSALTINNRLTYIDYGTLDAALTITVSAKKGLTKGSMLFILAKSDGTARNVTFSTGFKGAVLSGVINKTKLAMFIYDGTNFYCVSTQQVD